MKCIIIALEGHSHDPAYMLLVRLSNAFQRIIVGLVKIGVRGNYGANASPGLASLLSFLS